MYKYLLRFYKKGNMRFLSHLDLGRLFRRAIKKAEISVEYSNGFNPHEKINIVQPLSLGFESESEYFEIATKTQYGNIELMELLNSSMPEGIKFYECRETDPAFNNLSKITEAAVYSIAVYGDRNEFERLDIGSFLKQDDITIMKRDKKTKKMVSKSVKNMIYSIEKVSCDEGVYCLRSVVKCASNESLNPANLLTALYKFNNMDFSLEKSRIDRIDIFVKDKSDNLIPLFDFDK